RGRGPGRRAPRGGWRGRDSTRPGSTGGRSCGAAGRRGVFPPGSACRAAPAAGPRGRRWERGGGRGGGRAEGRGETREGWRAGGGTDQGHGRSDEGKEGGWGWVAHSSRSAPPLGLSLLEVPDPCGSVRPSLLVAPSSGPAPRTRRVPP